MPTEAPVRSSRIATSVVNPKARDRAYSTIERFMFPGTVESVLANALQGNIHSQWLMFAGMVDSWPRLQKNLSEIGREVAKAPFEMKPFARRGDEPSASAIKAAEEVEDLMAGMRPRPTKNEKGMKGLTEDLAQGYFFGHIISELYWNPDNTPRSTRVLDARHYAYPRDQSAEDELMLNVSGQVNGALESFDDYPHRFLIGMKGGHPGHPSISAPLRSLAGWWLASVFGLKWMMEFTQVYGVPLRWATYPAQDDCALEAVSAMLENVGSAGWGAFPKGTEMNIQDSIKGAGELPQRVLIEQADKQADIVILGQTLTSDVGNSGSRALGDVHNSVRQGVIEGIAEWVKDIFNYQLIPSISEVSLGRTDEIPCLTLSWPDNSSSADKAERDEVLFGKLGLPVGKDWLYERHGVPVPRADENVLSLKSASTGSESVRVDPETGKPVEALRATPGTGHALNRPIVDQLVDNVLEGLSGTSAEFLTGVRPFFTRLVKVALSEDVSDELFIETLEAATVQVPELFEDLNPNALQTALEKAISSGLLSGVGNRIID